MALDLSILLLSIYKFISSDTMYNGNCLHLCI